MPRIAVVFSDEGRICQLHSETCNPACLFSNSLASITVLQLYESNNENQQCTLDITTTVR